jgi:septal ring factor EnvC (AmiA/AmiB activator)
MFEDLATFLAKYAIETGGVFGFMLVISLGLHVAREYILYTDAKKTKEDNQKTVKELSDLSIKEIKNFNEQITKFTDILNKNKVDISAVEKTISEFRTDAKEAKSVAAKCLKVINEVRDSLSIFEDIHKKDDDRINLFISKYHDLGDVRAEELKTLIVDYNNAMSQTTVMLEKIKIILHNNFDEE